MWPLMVFDASPPSASSRFLMKDALKAMLAYSDNHNITNVSVAGSSHQNDANYTITVHLTRAGQPTTNQLHLRRDQSRSNWLVYPYWRVVVSPSVIQIKTYPHAGEVTLDGIDTGISGTPGSVDVIPGVHRLQLTPTGIFAGDTKQIDASGGASVAFDLQLSGPASAAATMTIDTFFDQCAKVQQLDVSYWRSSITHRLDTSRRSVRQCEAVQRRCDRYGYCEWNLDNARVVRLLVQLGQRSCPALGRRHRWGFY
jgi:hypothetical protein